MDDLKRLETLEDAIDSAQLREAITQNAGFTTLEAVIAQHPHEWSVSKFVNKGDV